jgi:hypothetical protein
VSSEIFLVFRWFGSPLECVVTRLFLLRALLLLLQHLLHDLLLLDKEGANDAVADAVTASRATVGTLNGLLGVGDLGVLARAESGDLE